MADITMSIDDTLELDAIIEKSNSVKNAITYDSNKFELTGIQTHTGIFDPKKTGTHSIEVNGQTLTVKVEGTSSIHSSAVHQYDATQESYSIGDIISSLTDQIGDSDMDSVTGDPVYKENLNSNPSIAFDGSDYLDPSSDFATSIDAPYTIIAVASLDSGHPDFSQIYEGNDVSSNNNIAVFGSDKSDDWRFRCNGTIDRGGTQDNNPHIFTTEYKSNSGEAYIDNSSIISSSSTPATLNRLRIGKGESTNPEGWDGLISEIIIYDDVSKSIRDEEYQRLKTKYGI